MSAEDRHGSAWRLQECCCFEVALLLIPQSSQMDYPESSVTHSTNVSHSSGPDKGQSGRVPGAKVYFGLRCHATPWRLEKLQ